MTTFKYKQCHLKEVDGPWETISLIEMDEISTNVITLTQYKVTRDFEIITAYPPIIKKKIINKTKATQ